jgi:hypothetical protein
MADRVRGRAHVYGLAFLCRDRTCCGIVAGDGPQLRLQPGTEYLRLDWSLDELMFDLSRTCPEQYALRREPI